MGKLIYSDILSGILWHPVWHSSWHILWHSVWQCVWHWPVGTWNCNVWARVSIVARHLLCNFTVQTFKATVFRRTLPCMLGTWHKNDFHAGSVVLIPFFLFHMHVHGVVQNKQAMPCFHRKPKIPFKNPMLLKRNPAPKMNTHRKMVKNFCKT